MNRRQLLLAPIATASPGCRRWPTASADRPAAIRRLFAELHARRLFDGEALVAERGVVLYRGAFGLANRDAKLQYTTSTPSCLASLSKPITAVAVMMMVEKGLLAFDRRLSQLLPGFLPAIGAVTVRQLLTHTSGMPDYPDLGVDRPGVTNAEILTALRQVKNPVFPPGLKYQYSNSGYVLLGQIVESLSDTPLPQFLASRIFQPLGMTSTFVLTSPEQKKAGVARGYDRNGGVNDFEGMATGDSGVYSTVEDLLRFDQALYDDTLVRQKTLALAFRSAQVREGSTTYGFGWNIREDDSSLKVWHQGNTAGFRAFIERRLSRRITVIMLTNGGDTDRMKINGEVQRILG
ncbi:MAG: beta-lactamase family protein [Bryobacterales bacterium]|nr:beta-lactamase family protein [Bryobacterales bacterium]